MLNRRIAYIDLSGRSHETTLVPEGLRRNYLGGRGINMHLLSRRYSRELDPLSPANPLLFGAGMLAGSLSFGSGVNISAKSPESGHLGGSA